MPFAKMGVHCRNESWLSGERILRVAAALKVEGGVRLSTGMRLLGAIMTSRRCAVFAVESPMILQFDECISDNE